jgi:dTDP-4-dehydrorhamnose 3,5-epimerase-like enzyme
MKILSVEQLEIPEIKVIRFARFRDERGYFTEHFRRDDFDTNPPPPLWRGSSSSKPTRVSRELLP